MSGIDIGIPGLTQAEPIGSGGNAIVYRAYDADHDRWVAVKVLRGLGDDAELRRFDRERRTMGRLSEHEGIVTIHSSGVNGRGEPYLVMSLLEHGSLQDRLDDVGPVPWPEAAEMMKVVARTVHAAHGQSVIHRDLKPANIMISAGGSPLVADFGIARHTGASASMQSTAITMTPAYSPPEVIEGAEATVAADVYALGATLYALITGSPPFFTTRDESLFALLRRVSQEPVRDLRPDGVADWLCQVIEQAMAKSPADRHASADDFARALDASAPTQPRDPGTTVMAASAATPSTAPADVEPAPSAGPAPDSHPATVLTETAGLESPPRGTSRLVLWAVVALVAVAAIVIAVLASTGGGGGAADPTGASGTITATVGDRVIRLSTDGSGTRTDVTTSLDEISVGEDQWIVPSRNGEWIVLDTARLGCEDWACLVVGRSDLSELEVVRIGDRFGEVVHPQDWGAVSDDGSVAIYTADLGPNELDLAIVRRAGDVWDPPVVLTAESPHAFNARGRITRDGSSVLFDCGPTPSAQEGTGVCRVALDGTGFARLIAPEDGDGATSTNIAASADEAPDGGLVFSADWGGGTRLWERVAGQTRLVSGHDNDNAPCVLPGGEVASVWWGRSENQSGMPELKVAERGSDEYQILIEGEDFAVHAIHCSS